MFSHLLHMPEFGVVHDKIITLVTMKIRSKKLHSQLIHTHENILKESHIDEHIRSHFLVVAVPSIERKNIHQNTLWLQQSMQTEWGVLSFSCFSPFLWQTPRPWLSSKCFFAWPFTYLHKRKCNSYTYYRWSNAGILKFLLIILNNKLWWLIYDDLYHCFYKFNYSIIKFLKLNWCILFLNPPPLPFQD